MQRAFLTILLLASVFSFNFAQAEVVDGKTCKNHLSPIFKIDQDRFLFNELIAIPEYADAKGVTLKTFRTHSSHSDRVNEYMRGVRSTIQSCKQHCEGIPFNVAKAREVATSLGMNAAQIKDNAAFRCETLEENTIYKLQSFIVAIDDDAKPGQEVVDATISSADFIDDSLTTTDDLKDGENPAPVLAQDISTPKVEKPINEPSYHDQWKAQRMADEEFKDSDVGAWR